MLDLFDTPVIKGLRSSENFLGPDEEQVLIERIDQEPLEPFRFQKWTGKRLTHSFGWSYDFQAGTNNRAEPIPRWLIGVRDRAASFARLEPRQLEQALLIRYDPGAGIGWHRDRPVYEHVIGISLGATTDLRFRRRLGEKWRRLSVPLEPRSIYHLGGEARHEWQHSIAEMTDKRWSITFRSFASDGPDRKRPGPVLDF